MRASEPAAKKYKWVLEDFPNLAILTKSATLDEVQLTFGHTTIGNKSLGESVVAFTLARNLASPSLVSIKMDIAFSAESNNIRIPITEVLLRAPASDLVRSKKQWDWTPHNAILLPPFLTEAAILDCDSDEGKLLNIFALSIIDWEKESENTSGYAAAADDNGEDGVEAEDKKTSKKGKAKQATVKTLATIVDNCNDVLAFLQAIICKSTQFTAVPLSLCADNSAHVWFCYWTDINLPTPPKPVLQEHMGLTSVLTDMVTRLHTAEALRPVVAAQSKAEKETKGWDRLPPTAQCIILAAKHYQRNLYSGLVASYNPLLPQREECDGPPRRFLPDLCR